MKSNMNYILLVLHQNKLKVSFKSNIKKKGTEIKTNHNMTMSINYKINTQQNHLNGYNAIKHVKKKKNMKI